MQKEQHIHKFIHPAPNGRVSIGKCECGKTDKAYNSTDFKTWKGKNKNND